MEIAEKNLYINTEEEIMMLLEICTASGAILLKNGAEIYRVEDTVERIIRSRKNVRDADVYSTFNVVMISFNVNGHVYSNVRRVKDRGNNLIFVDKVNTFSRDFCDGKYSLKEALLELERIKSFAGTDKYLITIGSAVAAAAFTCLIGGKISQALISFLVGLCSWLIHQRVEKRKFGYFIDNFINGILVGLLSILFTIIFDVDNRDLIIIGSIMPYLPGVILTNSIRDLLTGDTTTGLTGVTQAILISTALALGVAFTIGLIR
ncbi:MAG: threonine/serine exporter family protein [Peptoniphilaceae bacterium]|nr:threonine/serine exporter family protein [Peptoniphilaceae bacterium]MDY6019267.1 threonine/serine exporter family protein [Anaerococcus sp.]